MISQPSYPAPCKRRAMNWNRWRARSLASTRSRSKARACPASRRSRRSWPIAIGPPLQNVTSRSRSSGLTPPFSYSQMVAANRELIRESRSHFTSSTKRPPRASSLVRVMSLRSLPAMPRTRNPSMAARNSLAGSNSWVSLETTTLLTAMLRSSARWARNSSACDFPAPNSPASSIPRGCVDSDTLEVSPAVPSSKRASTSGPSNPSASTASRFGTPARSASTARRARRSPVVLTIRALLRGDANHRGVRVGPRPVANVVPDPVLQGRVGLEAAPVVGEQRRRGHHQYEAPVDLVGCVDELPHDLVGVHHVRLGVEEPRLIREVVAARHGETVDVHDDGEAAMPGEPKPPRGRGHHHPRVVTADLLEDPSVLHGADEPQLPAQPLSQGGSGLVADHVGLELRRAVAQHRDAEILRQTVVAVDLVLEPPLHLHPDDGGLERRRGPQPLERRRAVDFDAPVAARRPPDNLLGGLTPAHGLGDGVEELLHETDARGGGVHRDADVSPTRRVREHPARQIHRGRPVGGDGDLHRRPALADEVAKVLVGDEPRVVRAREFLRHGVTARTRSRSRPRATRPRPPP